MKSYMVLTIYIDTNRKQFTVKSIDIIDKGLTQYDNGEMI